MFFVHVNSTQSRSRQINCIIMLSPTLQHLLLSAGLAHAYSCINFNAPITVTAPSYIPSFKEFGSHFDSVQFLADRTTRVTEKTVSPFSGSENVTVTFSIDASFCADNATLSENQDVQILSHGVGFVSTRRRIGSASGIHR